MGQPYGWQCKITAAWEFRNHPYSRSPYKCESVPTQVVYRACSLSVYDGTYTHKMPALQGNVRTAVKNQKCRVCKLLFAQMVYWSMQGKGGSSALSKDCLQIPGSLYPWKNGNVAEIHAYPPILVARDWFTLFNVFILTRPLWEGSVVIPILKMGDRGMEKLRKSVEEQEFNADLLGARAVR